MVRGLCGAMLTALAAGALAGCGGDRGPATAGEGTVARTGLRLVRVAGGLEAPVHVAAPASEPNRLYIVEQPGRIRVLERGRLRVFLDIRGQVRSGGEQGLLSVAFHPRFARTRKLYVNYTDVRGDTRVVEYRSNGRQAIRGSARQLLLIDQPYSNHNGGQNAFGPDGRLYVGMGDGGSGGDPENRAQNLNSLLGKLLAIDVDAADPRPAVVGYGLRNPWRFSFDRQTGDLFIGDVGQGSFEEIDFTRRRSPGLENYGWDVYEGRARFENKRPNPAGELVFPIVVYPLDGTCSVVGGFVYRGRRVPAARGRYFYADYCAGWIKSFRLRGRRVVGHRTERFSVERPTSFGEGARGELFVVSHAGSVYRLARR
jgi:glucose/arabinose dehydrogenase